MRQATVFGLLISIVAFVLSLGMRISNLDGYGHKRAAISMDDDMLKSPGPDVLSAVSMGHRSALADVTWLSIVQELGSNSQRTNPSYDRLQRWAHIATDLDPRYFVVYYASAIHLMALAKRSNAAGDILSKGRRHIPERWELPFFQGYNAYFLEGDPIKAQSFWKEALPLKNVPRFVPSLIARAKVQSDDPERALPSAIQLLQQMLPALQGPHRRDAEIRIKILKTEIYLFKYDRACLKWQAEKSAMPTPKDIHEAGWVSEPPVDLFGNDVYFDTQCRARTKMIFLREDEAKKNLGSQREGKVRGPGIEVGGD